MKEGGHRREHGRGRRECMRGYLEKVHEIARERERC